MTINKPSSTILNLLSLAINGFFTFIHLEEWYKVQIEKKISDYPFGSEGPTPYYYKTTNLYSITHLVWGIIFMILFLFTSWIITKKKTNYTITTLGITLLLTIILFIQGQIE